MIFRLLRKLAGGPDSRAIGATRAAPLFLPPPPATSHSLRCSRPAGGTYDAPERTTGKRSTKRAPPLVRRSRSNRAPMSRARRRLSARPRPTPGAVAAASWADLLKERNKPPRGRRRDARTVVANRQPHEAVGLLGRQVDPPVGGGRRILAGVVDEIEKDLLDRRRVRPHDRFSRGGVGFHGQLHAGLPGAVGQPKRDRPQQLRKRQLFQPPHAAARAPAGRRPARSPPGASAATPRSARCQDTGAAWASGTIPSDSISVYMWNVVSGVRSSCVTAETNAARR